MRLAAKERDRNRRWRCLRIVPLLLAAPLLLGGCATPAGDQSSIPWGAPQEGEGFAPGEGGGLMGMPMAY